MLFQEKKLDLESGDDLLQCSIDTVKPYALMLAPVYVFMKLNQKYVSVKAPLDFFTEDELKRLRRYEVFYFSKFVQKSVQYQTAAKIVKSILQPPVDDLPRAPFEISHEIEIVILPLWGKHLRIEPFFMTIFADELCTPLPPELLESAREKTVVLHDRGLLLSGTAMFFAVQLGMFDFSHLCEWRKEIYTKTVNGYLWEDAQTPEDLFVKDIARFVESKEGFSLKTLYEFSAEWSMRLWSRLKRMEQHKKLNKKESPSVYGEEGFSL